MASFSQPAYVLEWAGKMGGGGDDDARAVVVDSSGNIYVGGNFKYGADLNPFSGTSNFISFGQSDIYLVKISPGGALIWAKQMGGMGDDKLSALALDSQGNVLLTGTFMGTADFDPSPGISSLVSASLASNALNVFVSKMDSSGNLLWVVPVHSTHTITSNTIATDSLDNIIIGGKWGGTADFAVEYNMVQNISATGGFTDMYILKITSTGNTDWVRPIGSYFGSEDVTAICISRDNEVIIAGTFTDIVDFNPGSAIYNLSSLGDHDVYILKLDSAGLFKWASKITGWWHQYAGAVTTDPVGNVYLTGAFEDLTDFNPAPAVYNIQSAGLRDAFILKLNPFGGFIWVKTFSGPDDQVSYAITTDAAGNLYTTGYCTDSTDLDPDTSTFWINGIANGFISCLDSSGNMLWSEAISSNTNILGQGISIYYDLYIYTVGYFSGLADFDPGLGITNLVSLGMKDGYIQKLKPATPTALDEININRVELFPNPTTRFIQITNLSGKYLQLINSLGEIVYARQLSESDKYLRLNLTGISPGVYFLITENYFGKIVKIQE